MRPGCLVVTLREQLRLALLDRWPVSDLVIEGESYRPVGPEWGGFYDWLRDRSGALLGVRYNATDETRFVLDKAKALDYAQIGEYDDLAIFFSATRSFDPDGSADQEFLYDQAFVSLSGRDVAVCFATDGLTDEQIEHLANGPLAKCSATHPERTS
jgi:hypothetical protein